MNIEDLDKLEAIAKKATKGPWEVGDRQLRERVEPERFGEGKCFFCDNTDSTLVHQTHGKNPIHTHELDEPYTTHGIYAYRKNGSITVIYDTEEYGLTADEDSQFIAATDPQVVLELIKLARKALKEGK